MKNKIEDLRNHLFAALERLNNEDLTPEELQVEIERSNAIKDIGSVIVHSAKVEVDYARAIGANAPVNKFIQIEEEAKRVG